METPFSALQVKKELNIIVCDVKNLNIHMGAAGVVSYKPAATASQLEVWCEKWLKCQLYLYLSEIKRDWDK